MSDEGPVHRAPTRRDTFTSHYDELDGVSVDADIVSDNRCG
jgi:hypothetical protein